MILTVILLTALINIALGIVVYNKNPKSDTHRLLTLLTVIFAAWSIANYFSLNSPNNEATLFWIRAVMFITAPLGPVLYFFIKAYPNPILIINRIFFKLLISLTVFVQAIAFSPFIFSSVTVSDQITPTPEFGIFIYGFLFAGMPIVGFVELVKKYRNAHGLEKLQLKYLIVGIAETFTLLIITNFVAVVVFNYSGFVLFGPLFSLILVAFVSYAIVRHRLLEIKIILARSIIYVTLIAIIAIFYAFAVFLTSQYYFGETIKLEQALLRVAIALFIAFTLIPIRNYLEKVTDKVFFKSKYDSNLLVFQLIKITASTISLDQLMNKTLNKLIRTLRIFYGAFIIYDGTKKYKLYIQGNKSYEDKRKEIDAIYRIKRIVMYDEEKNSLTKRVMRELDAAAIIPLFERGVKVGTLILGNKKSGQIYSSEDYKILQIFGPVIAVAIRNSKSYQKIKDFNITLKKEVQAATKDLKIANKRLKELSNLKDEFMAVASHELKTPVTSIKLYVQILLDRFKKKKDDKSYQDIYKMDMQLNKLVSLLNDLLDLSKIEEGKLRFEIEEFGIDDLINEIADEMKLITKHKIQVKTDYKGLVTANRERIGQVISNFVTNAIKYSPKANKIIINANKIDQSLVVSVQDFGLGLTPKEQKIVFDRFNRAGQEGPGGIPGLGLGLYISKEIINRHGGKIWLKSKKGVGSTFYFSIPINK